MVYALLQTYGGAGGANSWTQGFDWGPGQRDTASGFAYYAPLAASLQAGVQYPQGIDRGYSQNYDGRYDNQAYFGIDNGNTNLNAAANLGRASTNVTSLRGFRHGLFVFAMGQVPNNECGIWPIVGLVSSTSYSANKMDVFQSWNTETFNRYQIISKTNACKPPSNTASFTAVLPPNKTTPTDCSVNGACMYLSSPSDTTAAGTPFNIGNDPNDPSYGFGGFYALEWTSNRIAMWHFNNTGGPSDLTGPAPNPSQWPTPSFLMSKADGCDPDVAFPDLMRINILINFCGTGAGTTYASSGCQNGTQDCPTRIAALSDDLELPYFYSEFFIRNFTVYQDPGDPVATSQLACPSLAQDPYYGNTSNPSVPLGCYNDLSNWSGFSLAQTFASNVTAAQCYAFCGGQAYSAIVGTNCYCSSSASKNS